MKKPKNENTRNPLVGITPDSYAKLVQIRDEYRFGNFPTTFAAIIDVVIEHPELLCRTSATQ